MCFRYILTRQILQCCFRLTNQRLVIDTFFARVIIVQLGELLPCIQIGLGRAVIVRTSRTRHQSSLLLWQHGVVGDVFNLLPFLLVVGRGLVKVIVVGRQAVVVDGHLAMLLEGGSDACGITAENRETERVDMLT